MSEREKKLEEALRKVRTDVVETIDGIRVTEGDPREYEERLAQIDAALSLPPETGEAVPEGWQLVPRLATTQMLSAAIGWRETDSREGIGAGEIDMFDRAYDLMLAAAPASPAPAGQAVVLETTAEERRNLTRNLTNDMLHRLLRDLDKLLAAQPAPSKDVGVKTNGKAVTLMYRNYRGETAPRTIIPHSFWWGSTEWHPEEQWLVNAIDVEKNASRDFALLGFFATPESEWNAAVDAAEAAIAAEEKWYGGRLRDEPWNTAIGFGRAAIRALKRPAPAAEPTVPVSLDALRWLMGAGPSPDFDVWFGDDEPVPAKGKFWWRRRFAEMAKLPPTVFVRDTGGKT